MAAQIVHLPIAPCHVAYRTFPFPRQRPEFRSHATKEKPHYVRLPPPALAAPTAAAEEGGANGGSDGGTVLSVDYGTTGEIKDALSEALEGINRGIFGASSAKKKEIEGFVELLESRNPTPCPTDNLAKVDGCWKLVYSTLSILGSKRTKLGLRDFITLGDFLQTIDVAQRKAINEIKFNARGFKMLSGQLSIVASYEIASKTRVDIKFVNSDIAPDQLMDLFQKNYDLLLAIFNPDGWLEITYVDEYMRIGRDDKGNIFILERLKQDGD